jgi:hypothetical protein
VYPPEADSQTIPLTARVEHMNSIGLSQWRTSFAAVLFETDKSRLKSRITDASRGISERLQSLEAGEGVDRISLEAARRSLAELERLTETSFVLVPQLDNSIPLAGNNSLDLQVKPARYDIGSHVRITLPSGAMVTAEIVVIFTASVRKNIMVSFDKRFLRIGPEQIVN